MRFDPRSALPALLVSLAACASEPETTAPPASSAGMTVSTSGTAQADGTMRVTSTSTDADGKTTTSTQVLRNGETVSTGSSTSTTTMTYTSEEPSAGSASPAPRNKENAMPAAALPTSFYGFKTTTLEGKPADLSSYKGKVVLVVNTASQCGLTKQYTGLEKLHEDLSGKGFSVLGFPSNDFGGQEPGTPAEIRDFCDTKYHVTFPLFSKVQTKAGEGQSPIYTWLQDQTNQLPRWNFGKYLIGKDGKVVQVFDSKIEPEDPALRSAIDKALGS